MAFQDYTTYTEVDADSHISVAANTITITNMQRRENELVYKDFGASHFAANFEHLLKTTTTGYATNGVAGIWMLANSVDDANNATDRLFAYWFKPNTSGDTINLNLRDAAGTTDTSVTLSSITYYVTIERDESVGTNGTLFAYIYDDSGRTNLIDTLSIALASKADLRYLYGCASFDSNSNASWVYSCTVANLDIQEASGGNTYSETGSGGAVVAGVARNQVRLSNVATGGAILNSSALINSTMSPTTSGGVIVNGNALDDIVGGSETYNEIATGGAVLAGLAPASLIAAPSPSGGIICQGTGPEALRMAPVASGGLLIDGSAGRSYILHETSTGGVVINGEALASGQVIDSDPVVLEVQVADSVSLIVYAEDSVALETYIQETLEASVS